MGVPGEGLGEEGPIVSNLGGKSVSAEYFIIIRLFYAFILVTRVSLTLLDGLRGSSERLSSR